MTDRELLEKAAKAAGIEAHYPFGKGEIYVRHTGLWASRDTSDEYGALVAWNPLADDAQALRLAVRLRLDFCIAPDDATVCVWCAPISDFMEEQMKPDEMAATRRAIVRAAAALEDRP